MWIWPDTTRLYPELVRQDIRVGRVRDLAMTEAVLVGYAGRWGAPSSLAAAWQRAHGEEPADEGPADPTVPATELAQQPLFAPEEPSRLPGDVDPLAAAVLVYADQRRRIQAAAVEPRIFEPAPVTPARLDLLAATDSAAALIAVEMRLVGLPWHSAVHDRLLTEALGERPRRGDRPPVLQRLAEEIGTALGEPHLNPDSPAAVMAALTRAGLAVRSTRAHELRALEHPVIDPLLQYKELARLWTASGWAWQEAWVHDGRFRPEYVPAGVVSGRWASRGGGALQIPRNLRSAVVADPGCDLIVADAGQLEPRILAALSRDPGMTRAAAGADLYAELAAESFSGDRSLAKVGLLSAMYGGSSPALATLRERYPGALGLLEAAARTGEAGGLVRSVLGRTCPPPGPADPGSTEEQAIRRSRDRGRFTRNFVIQASAADWAGVVIAVLRRSLAALPAEAGDRPELVFFQHDEVVVHTPTRHRAAVIGLVDAAAVEATRLVFATRAVPMPLEASAAADYASAKLLYRRCELRALTRADRTVRGSCH